MEISLRLSLWPDNHSRGSRWLQIFASHLLKLADVDLAEKLSPFREIVQPESVVDEIVACPGDSFRRFQLH